METDQNEGDNASNVKEKSPAQSDQKIPTRKRRPVKPWMYYTIVVLMAAGALNSLFRGGIIMLAVWVIFGAIIVMNKKKILEGKL